LGHFLGLKGQGFSNASRDFIAIIAFIMPLGAPFSPDTSAVASAKEEGPFIMVLRRLPGKGCIEPLIQSHGTTESHGERASG
jgi:hypothetical protein